MDVVVIDPVEATLRLIKRRAGSPRIRPCDELADVDGADAGLAKALRQIMVQRFVTDARGRLRPRREEDGFPPAGRQICSPYDLDARFVLRGHTRWTGYLAHVTETCDPVPGTVNVITDVATTVSSGDSRALPGIHTRLQRRGLLPAQHLVDAGYTSVALLDAAARDHQVELVGPLPARGSWQRKEKTGYAREDFVIDFDRRQVTCPTSKITGNWVAAPAMAPYIAARFDARQCDPCRVRSSCTRGTSARTINFLPRHLHELQARHRAAQDTPEWKRLYGARSGIEGTVNECANGHQMRRCRYHGLGKAHVQHVLTAIAINIERLSEQEPGHSTHRPRTPTAFQHYLDTHGMPRPLWWRQGK